MATQLYRTITGQSTKSKASESSPNLQRTTTDPLTGRLNHLSADEEVKLEEFKAKLQKGNWWTPDGINGKPSHDDGTLLRYLRARKFNVDDAIGQFTDTEKWMKENMIEDLYEHFDVEIYERARSMYPQWTGRRDKRGIPVYVFEIKGLDSKNVSAYQKESEKYKKTLPNHKKLAAQAKLMPLFALYHNLLNFVLPLCSTLERPHPEVPVTNSTNIVDISGVGLGQFWNLKQHMQDASVLATAHYPETLDRIFIIGAPAFFPTVWSWIKRWFDPVTVSKIFILGKNEVKPTLESFMPLSSFPKKYGGELDWGWGDLPKLGPEELAAVAKDGSKEWVRGPCLWLEGERVIVGTDNGKPRRSDKEIAEKKPVVYAADYTEEPVHEDRKGSTSKTPSAQNGSAVVSPASAPKEDPVVAAPAAAVAATSTNEQPPAAAAEPVNRENLNVKNSPMGDSQVHLPDSQPAPPAQTAEYISPTISPKDAPTTTAKPAEGMPALPASSTIAQPPPGHTKPGPLSEHQVAVAKTIAANLEKESTYTIPASSGANGELPHPEVVAASDAAKGLAIEAEKLQLGQEQNAGRPEMERFFTAQDIKQ